MASKPSSAKRCRWSISRPNEENHVSVDELGAPYRDPARLKKLGSRLKVVVFAQLQWSGRRSGQSTSSKGVGALGRKTSSGCFTLWMFAEMVPDLKYEDRQMLPDNRDRWGRKHTLETKAPSVFAALDSPASSPSLRTREWSKIWTSPKVLQRWARSMVV
jgi:hypothetical protein